MTSRSRVTPDERAHLQAIGAFVDELETPGFVAGTWFGGERHGDVITMPWFELGDRASAFVAALTGIMIVGFDWMTWVGTPEAQMFGRDHATIATATPEQLAHLATAIVRQARFTEGSHDEAFESGLMLAVARRARALAADDMAL